VASSAAVSETERKSMPELLAQGPLPLREATLVALDLLDAAEERWTAWEAPDAIDPSLVAVDLDGRSLGGRRAGFSALPAQPAEPAPSGPTPRGVRAIARLYAGLLGADPGTLREGENGTATLAAAARPLLACALSDSGPRPLRTFGALREGLWSILHLTNDGTTLAAGPRASTARSCLSGGAMPGGVVRRVQLGVRGKAGVRDAAWCVVRLPGGGLGQAVLVVDPEAGETAHHARTLRCLWPGAELAAWGLPEPDVGSAPDAPVFALRPETSLVLEPLRLFEVSTVASCHGLGCPLHFLAQLAGGAGTLGAPLLLGRRADAALLGLLEHPERSNAAIAGDALRDGRADSAWLRTDRDVERVEGPLRTLIPNLRAWLERRSAGAEAMNEVPRMSLRFGLSGRSDLVLPRPDAPPAIGELKSGQARRYDASPAADGAAALPGYHAAQARLYALIWSDAWLSAAATAQTGPARAVATELFYAGSNEGYRLGPDPKELSGILATRNEMLDALRRAVDGETMPPAPPLADCRRCYQKATCPRPTGGPRPLDAVRGSGAADAVPPLQAAYVRHFTRLLLRSVWHAQGLRRGQLEPSGRAARVAALTAEEGLDLRFDRRSSRAVSLGGPVRGALRAEDDRNVLVHRGDAGALDAFEAEIERLESQGYRLRLSWPRPPWLAEGSGWIVEETRRFEGERDAFEGLARLEHRGDENLLTALVTGGEPAGPREATELELPPPPFPGTWHPSQEEALRRGLGGGVLEPIQGPPGTGKTVFVGSLVAALVRAGRRVVVGALTHNAADQAARRIVEAGVHDLLRIGARPDSLLRTTLAAAGLEPAHVFFEEFARRAKSTAAARTRLTGAPVVVATCTRLGHLPWRGEFAAGRTPPFDVAVLDEATQIAEPAALATIALARRTVLVGDPMQLSGVEPAESEWAPEPPADPRLREAGVAGLARSLLERLCAQGRAAMLRRQHRMHERIMALPNRAFYGGLLEAAPEARARLLELEPGRAGALPPWLETVVRPEEPLVLVDVPQGSSDRLNEREGKLVAEAAAALRRAGLDAARIGVVTPYRAQVALIRRLLAAEPDLAGIPVDTVERFQGDERDAILVSLVGGRPTGHLAHPNRINVTLTRARSKLVVFGDAEGLSRDPLLAELVRQPETTRVASP
jgi:DNA replication ATP-dependent helicase Dna2